MTKKFVMQGFPADLSVEDKARQPRAAEEGILHVVTADLLAGPTVVELWLL